MPVRLRIPLLVIHSVENPAQLGGARAQQAVHTKTEFGGLDFAGIGRADGVDRIRPNDAGLQEIEAPEEFQSLRVEQPGVETEVGDSGGRKASLVSEVMDGQDTTDPEKRRIQRETLADIHRQQSRLPIVRMKNVRAENGAG